VTDRDELMRIIVRHSPLTSKKSAELADRILAALPGLGYRKMIDATNSRSRAGDADIQK